MSVLHYQLLPQGALLQGWEGGAGEITLHITPREDGSVRFGAVCAPLCDGVCRIGAASLPEGEIFPILIGRKGQIRLPGFVHRAGDVLPAAPTATDCATRIARLYALEEEVARLRAAQEKTERAVFGTTIF